VALAIAFVGHAAPISEALHNYDHIWWLLITGGLATSLLALPLGTAQAVHVMPRTEPDTVRDVAPPV
jgi:hypothetical protein